MLPGHAIVLYTIGYYKEAFALECKAMVHVITVKGFTNIKLMIPFVRTSEEGEAVLQALHSYGIVQSLNSSTYSTVENAGKCCCDVYMMCEIPSNAICIDSFIPLFNGFSIGSNDLTQLTLAIDRNTTMNSISGSNIYLTKLFDERNEAVLRMIKLILDGVNATSTTSFPPRRVGICGEAPSNHPEYCKYLISLGISSISLFCNPGADNINNLYNN